MSLRSLSSWPAQDTARTTIDDVPAANAELEAAATSRTLVARLGYTCAKWGAGLDQGRFGDGTLLSFSYTMFGLSTSVHEGVLLGSADPNPVPRLQRIAGEIGASLLKVTRTAPLSSVPGEVHTRKLRRWTIVRRSFWARDVLPLGSSYEHTLASFGRHTRRNIRNARKIALDAGLRFEASTGSALLTGDEHARLAQRTQPRSVPASLSRRLEAYADRTGQPVRSVVRAPDGEIVSYACGYLGDPASAYLLYQLNDPAFNALSPSLLHRAHLIQWLVERGCAELLFVHGGTGVLPHACLQQPLEEFLLMRRTPVGYLAASPFAFTKSDSSLGRLVRAAVLPTVRGTM